VNKSNDQVHDIVAKARELRAEIIAASDEAEQLRRIPQALSNHLASAGLYQMYLPRHQGGIELPPLRVFEAIEELSIADGSVGWCLMNANGICLTAGWLDPEVARHLFGPSPDIRVAGSLRPLGRAWPVDGGYKISGTWNFASGLHNANWLYCPCVIMDGNRPSTTPTGTPVARSMWVPLPQGSVEILDRWSVMGLRATGSDDFAISNLFVPQAHSVSILDEPRNFNPLYRPRIFLALFHLLFAANALGMARGALNQLIEMAHHEASSSSTTILRDRPLVQGRVGQAEAIVRAARCYVVASLEQCWTAFCSGNDQVSEELAQLRLAIAHAINESVRAADLLFAAAGTNSIYTANPIERRFRDIHVAVQHYAAFPIHYESAGKVMMGLTPSEPGW
jgi:indole-3-acetate monooxygenase